MKISSATALSDLSEEFSLFTHAPFFVFGGLDRDPVQDFLNTVRGNPVLAQIRSEKPIFSGLEYRGDPCSTFGVGLEHVTWNFVLIAVEKPAWDDCLNFLSGVEIRDTPKKIRYRALPHEVMIADGLLLSRQAVLPVPLPMVKITVFGVEGMGKKITIRPAVSPPVDLARVTIRPTRGSFDHVGKSNH